MSGSPAFFSISMRSKLGLRLGLYCLGSATVLLICIMAYSNWLFPSAKVSPVESLGFWLFGAGTVPAFCSIISLATDNARRPGRPWWMPQK
jgi:hypothetical protein